MPGTPWSPSPASIWKRAQPGPTPKCLCPRVIHSHREHTEGFKGVQRALPTTAQCPTVLHSGQECTEGFKGSAHTCPLSQDFSEWPGAGRGAQWANPKPGQCWRFFQKQPGAHLPSATEFSTEAWGKQSGSEGSHYTGPGQEHFPQCSGACRKVQELPPTPAQCTSIFHSIHGYTWVQEPPPT